MKIKNNNNKGLTLIEALIWFAIFAAVIAGVFSLYSNSRNSNNVSTVNKELSTIFTKVEPVYSSEPSSELTNLIGLQLGVFPSSVKVTDSTKGTISNVFGGTITLASNGASGYAVTYTKVPKGDVCANIVRSQKNVGWHQVNLFAVKYSQEYSLTKVTALCGANGSGTVDLRFARDNEQV